MRWGHSLGSLCKGVFDHLLWISKGQALLIIVKVTRRLRKEGLACVHPVVQEERAAGARIGNGNDWLVQLTFYCILPSVQPWHRMHPGLCLTVQLHGRYFSQIS